MGFFYDETTKYFLHKKFSFHFLSTENGLFLWWNYQVFFAKCHHSILKTLDLILSVIDQMVAC